MTLKEKYSKQLDIAYARYSKNNQVYPDELSENLCEIIDKVRSLDIDKDVIKALCNYLLFIVPFSKTCSADDFFTVSAEYFKGIDFYNDNFIATKWSDAFQRALAEYNRRKDTEHDTKGNNKEV